MASPDRKLNPSNLANQMRCLVRFSWTVLGNFAILLCAASIFDHNGSFLSPVDAVFWPLVVLLIRLRYLDITRLSGRTFTGQPASLLHWKRYALLLSGSALVLWSVAHAAAWLRA